MDAEDRFLARAVDAVMLQRNLSDPQQLEYLTDVQILRCTGVGRKGLNAIRAKYPYKFKELDSTFASSFMIAQSVPTVAIGSIQNVVAVRVAPDAILIRRQREKELVPIWLTWSAEVDQSSRPIGEGFGTIPDYTWLRSGLALPMLEGVERVELTFAINIDDFWSADILITTSDAIFRIDLYGNDEAPEEIIEDEESDGIDFQEELFLDPELEAIYHRLLTSWKKIDTALEKEDLDNALSCFEDSFRDIETLMHTAATVAAQRGITLVDPVFGLTATDHSYLESQASRPDGQSWESIFSYPVNPVKAVSRMCRICLEKYIPDGLMEIRRCISQLDVPFRDALLKGVECCEQIALELDRIRAALVASGKLGILRKEILSEVDGRFRGDGGMARRAVKRWLDTSAYRQELLRIKSPKGQIIRIADTAR